MRTFLNTCAYCRHQYPIGDDRRTMRELVRLELSIAQQMRVIYHRMNHPAFYQ